MDKLKWFRDAKLGMFVHWGCYAVLGRGEQILNRDMMPLDEYEPIAQDFKPEPDWAERLAERAVKMGAKYVVLTTRHHDGYCLFDTRTHDFNAVKTGPGRDLITEYVQAARAAGLKVGFYYSVVNWRWRGFWDPKGHADDFPKIADEMYTQVHELMSNYGKVDMLWYDCPNVPGSSTPGSFGLQKQPIDQTPAEFFRSAEVNAMARELQPQIIINNRSGLPEDFGTPEQHIKREDDPNRCWETCMTLNFAPGWAYLKHSMANKSAGEVLFNLVSACRLGGNFLFNVGPRADGYIDDREASVLDQIGRWVDTHAEAIYGTRPTAIYDDGSGQGRCFHYGMFTGKDSTVYMTLFYYPGEYVVISRIGPGIKSARLLTTGQELKVEPMRNARWKISGLPEAPPDPLAPVIQIEFEDKPYPLTYSGADWLDGEYQPE